MHSSEKNKAAEQESDDEELSENEQKNLESILVLFPYRSVHEKDQQVDDVTFEKIKSALSCRICLEVYKDPVYTKDCMHRFCKQCIEKIIRSQQNKSCPFCRTPLGSKRVLRNDYITEHIISKIFPDLKMYLSLEEEQDKHYYTSKIRELQEGSKGNRRKNKGDGSPSSVSQNKKNLTPTGEKKDKKRTATQSRVKEEPEEGTGERPEKKLKRRNKNITEVTVVEEITKKEDTTITSKVEEPKDEESKEPADSFENHAQKLIEDVHHDELLLANLKHLMEREDLNEIIMSLDFLTPVIIEPLPSESYLKHLENPVVKTTSAIKVEQLAKFICKKLNLSEPKFKERIKVWIKKDSKYEVVDRKMTLKEIGNKYWSHLDKLDWEVYDLITHVEEYLNKRSKPIQNERVLYYSVYLDDWL